MHRKPLTIDRIGCGLLYRTLGLAFSIIFKGAPIVA
jgi:hypothetical protein